MKPLSRNVWGYIVSVAGFVAFAGCLSPLNSYGRIFTAIQHDLNTTAVQTGWIGSVAWCGNFLTSPLAVILVRFGGHRVIAVLAASVIAGSYLACSFMNGFIGILIFYGVLAGAMSGVMIHITYSVIMTTFDPSHHNRGTSLASSGASAGTIILTIAYEKLVPSLGWRRSLQMTSVFCAVLAVPSAFLLAPQGKDSVTEQKTSNADENGTTVNQVTNDIEGFKPASSSEPDDDQPKHKRWLRLLFMLRTWLLFFGLAFPAMSWSVYWVNTISFYESIAVPADDIFLYVTIQTFSDLAGRVSLSVFGPCLTILPAPFLLLASNLTLLLVTVVVALTPTKAVLLISSFFVGVGRGWNNVLPVTASVDLLQVANTDQAVTVSMVALGVGLMLGTLLAGFIYDATGSYRNAFLLNAVFYMLGAVLIIALMLLKKVKRNNESRKRSQRNSMAGVVNTIQLEEK